MKMTEFKGIETKELVEKLETEVAKYNQMKLNHSVTPGRILFEVEGVPFDIAKEALRLGAQKLPVKTKFVVRRDYDKNA